MVVVVVGCGETKDGPPGRSDASGLDNDATDAPSMMSACTAAPNYTGVPISQNASSPASDQVDWLGLLDSSSTPDYLHIQLREGYGTFANGFMPKTVQLTGGELYDSTCGACVFVLTDVDPQITDRYFATGGTLDLTSVSGQLQGTIANLTLQHVVYSSTLSLVPANDGCTVSIPSATISATIQ